MLERFFDQRDTTVKSLIKLGDCLGRSLRENIALFNIDGNKGRVTYITESDNIINGDYTIDNDIALDNIEVISVTQFRDDNTFDGYVKEKISEFTHSLYEDNFSQADTSFSDILSLWENRLKFDKVRKHLIEKSMKFSKSLEIVETAEFKNFLEMRPQITEYLSEQKEAISKIPEVINAFKLANTVSKAFDFPALTLDSLVENKSYTLKEGNNSSIYEMICRQELVKQELIEAKKNFSTVWANNDKIRTLAAMIYEEKDRVEEVLAEALAEVPYLAVVSKKNLSECIQNSLSISEGKEISSKDIKGYVADLFEMKAPVRKEFISFLNEKYGINVQNLKEPLTFKSLVNTQVVIFEALSKLSPKGSLQKKVLSETAAMLKRKTGVEAIDVNDSLYELFNEAGYGEFITERVSLNPDSYSDIASDFKSITGLLDVIRQHADIVAAEEEEQYPSDETMEAEPEADDMAPEEEEMPPEEGREGEEMPPEEGMEGEEMPPEELGDEDLDQPAMAPEDVPVEGEEPEEGGDLGSEEMAAEADPEAAKEELVDNLRELEDLIADLQQDLGLGGEEEMPEEGEEEFPEEEEEEEEKEFPPRR